jgi:hypothetical protein
MVVLGKGSLQVSYLWEDRVLQYGKNPHYELINLFHLKFSLMILLKWSVRQWKLPDGVIMFM